MFKIRFTLAVLFVILSISSTLGNNSTTEDKEKEFEEYCHKQRELRRDPESVAKDCKRIEVNEFQDDDLRIVFILFMIILWGALVRTAIRVLKINIPYTVVLLLSGIILGLVAKYHCFSLYTFTAIARTKPELILFTFLPVLIFETAFGISSHVFFRASGQILILAFPGMVIATALTAMLCYQFFADYHWSFLISCFYGSIISATDPVAVVSILKEVGVSESLSVIIDGESLLNDGVAILLFEIFRDLVKEEDSPEQPSGGRIAGKIIVQFVQIAIGGPAFGYVMAKIVIFCLARIFNDAVVEITITLTAAYMTYYLAEAVLGVSGVCAVVLLGITMSAEKTAISPEILGEVHEFWEMLAHLANTVLFFFTGIVIAERGSRDLGLVDVYYLILLYFALNFIRFLMLLVLSPLLSRCGYGITWQNLMIMMWGGLRGGVGICLSLQVYEDSFFCEGKNASIGSKMLFHTAGIVLLTLIINGTTTKKLLDLLGLTAVTMGQMEEMELAVKHMMDARLKCGGMLKHDRYLNDANWDYIYAATVVENPYQNLSVKAKSLQPQSSILSIHIDTRQHPCPGCGTLVENEPSNEEYRVMTEEARQRVLKALKISYWKQFEQGVLSEEAVKILVAVSDSFTDKELAMIHTNDIRKYCQVRGFFPWLRGKMIAQFGPSGNLGAKMPPKPLKAWRGPCWWLATRSWFDMTMNLVVLLNVIPVVWELALHIPVCDDPKLGRAIRNKQASQRRTFMILNIIFITIYLLELIIKFVGLGCKNYWRNKWNILDFIVVGTSVLEFAITRVSCSRGMKMGSLLKVFRMFRLVRCLRLIKPMIPMIIKFLNTRVNRAMFFGYDVGSGYLCAVEDVLKYITQMIENVHVARKIRTNMERERLEIIKEIATIQRDHPGIAIAVKTRHASRNVLNQMRNALQDLRMDGLLDEKENTLLTIEVEEQMKRLWNSPSYIPPSSPEVLLDNLSWVIGNDEMKDFIFSNAEIIVFHSGDVISSAGEQLNGIYVMVSGMIKISYNPSQDIIDDKVQFGAIPCMELFRDFDFDKRTQDFFTFGTVLGESGIITKRVRTATVACESEEVKAYFIPLEVMNDAMTKFNDPYDNLACRLWRSCGIRRGLAYLPTTTYYQTWTAEKLQMHLERSCVPIGPQFDIIEIPPYVLDVFVIEGFVQDFDSDTVFTAPCLVSRSCTKFIYNADNPKTVNRVLLITQDKIGSDVILDELARCVISSYTFRRGVQRKGEDGEGDGGKLKAWLHLDFSARLRRRRKTTYVADDDKTTKDETIRRRAVPVSGKRRSSDDPGPEASIQ